MSVWNDLDLDLDWPHYLSDKLHTKLQPVKQLLPWQQLLYLPTISVFKMLNWKLSVCLSRLLGELSVCQRRPPRTQLMLVIEVCLEFAPYYCLITLYRTILSQLHSDNWFHINTFAAMPNVPWASSRVGLLLRCQLVICCGAGEWLSYMYWMTNILVSGTYRCTLIDEITRQWQRTC